MERKTKVDNNKLEELDYAESELAKKLNISIQQLAEWKETYPDLMKIIEENKDYFDDKVEQALLKRALGYEYEETEIIASKDGKNSKVKKTKKVIPPDTTAIIFWLKNRQPSKWRNRIELQHEGQIKTETNMQELSIEELRKLANIE